MSGGGFFFTDRGIGTVVEDFVFLNTDADEVGDGVFQIYNEAAEAYFNTGVLPTSGNSQNTRNCLFNLMFRRCRGRTTQKAVFIYSGGWRGPIWWHDNVWTLDHGTRLYTVNGGFSSATGKYAKDVEGGNHLDWQIVRDFIDMGPAANSTLISVQNRVGLTVEDVTVDLSRRTSGVTLLTGSSNEIANGNFLVRNPNSVSVILASGGISTAGLSFEEIP